MTGNNKKIRPYIRQFYRGNQGYLFLAVLLTICNTAANLMVSWLIQEIVDMASGKNVGFSFVEITALCVCALAIIVVGYGLSYISKPRFISKAVAQYKNYVFSELSRKSIAAFSSENTSIYISALSNDINSIETGYLNNIFVILDQMVLLAGALGLMFYYSPLLTIISILFAVLPMLASVLTGNMVAVEEKKVSEKNETYMSTLRDALSGFSVVKSFRAEAQMCRMFAGEVRAVADAKERRRKRVSL